MKGYFLAKTFLKRFLYSLWNLMKTGSAILYIVMMVVIYITIYNYPLSVPTKELVTIFVYGNIFYFGLLAFIVILTMFDKKYEDPPFDYCFNGLGKKSKLYKKSIKCLRQGAFNGALQCLQKLQELKMNKDETATANFCLGRCYQYMGYPTNALKYYDIAIENEFPSITVYYNSGKCCVDNGQFDRAIEYFTLLHKIDHYADYYYTELGMIELKRKNAEKALQYFCFSIDNYLDYATALGGAAVACLLLHRFDESRAYYCSAIVNNISEIDSFTTYYKSIADLVGYDPNTSVGNDSGSISAKSELMQE